MATTYDELKVEIQSELDNNNPNLIAAIPQFIHRAERKFNRQLRTLEMELRLEQDLSPAGGTEETRGVYDLPADWHAHKTVEVRGDKLWLLYFQRIPSLSGAAPTNWLLDKADDLYLYASLVFAEPWLKNDQRVALWAKFADSAINEVVQDDQDGRYGGKPLKSRLGTQHFYRGLTYAQGRYTYLPPYDFFDMESTGRQAREFGYSPGVFTVAERKLRILPKPALVP